MTSSAISSIIRRAHENSLSNYFSLVVVKTRTNFEFFLKLANDIVQKSPFVAVEVSVVNIKSGQYLNSAPEKWPIVLCNEETRFSNFTGTMLETPKRGFTLKYYGYHKTFNQNYSVKNQNIHNHEEFLLAHESGTNSLLLLNNIVFEDNCYSTFRVIDVFSLEKLEWSSMIIFQKYFRKFNNCPIPISRIVSPNAPPLNKLFDMIANFYAELYDLKFDDDDSKRTSPQVELLIDSSHDMPDDVGVERKETQRTQFIFFSSTTFLVCRGAQFTPFEKLILPFDYYTWLFLALTFFSSLTTITLIKSLKINVRKFVFGDSIDTPVLNFFQIFFGISLTRVPSRNFARYIFVLFTMFCLVIRTAYQGQMFDFLHKNTHRMTVRTVQEMFDKNIITLVPENLGENDQIL